jgi:sugar phosphate isomerase/epimerase
LREVSWFAAELGAPLFIVAPTAYPRVQPVADPHDEWKWAVEGIRLTGEHAGSLGVDLTLECWNRYGTYMLNRLDEGARLWRETGLTNGGIMADTFHMNVEERSIPGAIRDFGDLLNHVHLSDSNRLAPGLGHLDFTDILQALRAVRYGGGSAFELIPALPNILEAGIDLLRRCGHTGFRPYARSRATASAHSAGDAPGLKRCERDRSQGVRGLRGLRTTPSDRTGRTCPGS